MATVSKSAQKTLLLSPTQLEFIEKLSVFSRLVGLPKSIFRVMGLLAVCHPAEQSALNIQAALKLSAGSVSIATSFLTKMKLIERIKLPRDRQYYYRLKPDGFEKALEQRLEVIAQARKVVEIALADDPENVRLRTWHDFYAIDESELRIVIDRMSERTRRSKA